MGIRLETFFILQRLIGSRADRCYRRLLAMERWPADRLAAWRDGELRALLDHAASQIPHYKKLSLSAGAPLSAFPIISKDILHEHYRSMMTPTLLAEYERSGKRRGYGWMEVTSGGTTGIPTTVIHDAGFRDQDRAARLYEQHMAGFPFGTRHIRLWGSMHDIQRTKTSRPQQVMACLARETLLNAFQMDDDQIRHYIDAFKRHAGGHMIAYVDALEQIGIYACNHGISLPAFTSIMTTGGSLTEDTEAFLRQTFRARIHNKYGSRDCGELACACEHGLLHILSPNVHLELLDEHDTPVAPGKSGRVIVTFLGNNAFPIIRFDIGDIAIAGPAACSCGRTYPTLKRVTARSVDIIRSTSGGYITPVYIRHTVGVMHGKRKFRRYQFIQHDRARYELLIQPEESMDRAALDETLPGLRADLMEVLGKDAELSIHYQMIIPETSGGKFRHVVNKYKPGEE